MMKINSKLLVSFIILVSLVFLIALIVSNYKTEAILKAEEFCKMFNITCENESSIKFLSKSHSPASSATVSKKHAIGDIFVSFPKLDQYGNKFQNINFIMGRKSKEIEVYYNLGLKNKLKEKYKLGKDLKL